MTYRTDDCIRLLALKQPSLLGRSWQRAGDLKKTESWKRTCLQCLNPFAVPNTCLLFVLTGSENYLGVITAASLLPGESVVVCGASWFQALH